MLGVHWIADAIGCAPERLTKKGVERALVELPERLGLTRINEPQLVEHVDRHGQRSLAGIVLIAESHVSTHCFPEDRSVHIDVFSCREMDLDVARNYVAQYFEAEELTEQTLRRGDGRMTPKMSPTAPVQQEGGPLPGRAQSGSAE